MQVNGLDHINIVTSDVAGTVAFYTALLGLVDAPVPPLPAGYVVRWLADGTGQAIFHVQQFDEGRHGARHRAPETGAIDHVALNCVDHAGMLARCEQLGVAFWTNDLPDGSLRQIFLTDPNGLVLELNFRTG